MLPAEHNEDPVEPVVDAEALPAGTKLLNGQYTIERYLSGGGFGITYLARDSLDRVVVIKECFPEALCSRKQRSVMTRSSAQKDEFASLVRMFLREAYNVARLKHPNIVGVHQVFEDNDTAYMALDLIDGQDLLEKLENHASDLTPPVIKRLLRTLLDAISLVHDQDMLHRDISPDNILMDQSGEPVLIDFGAAREEASKKSRAISALLVVKDGYSPQEFYISGGKQGPFSDLYSLAATFYHLIAGEAPTNSQMRLAELAANRPDPLVPLVGRVEGYDHAFLAAIDKAMSVFPDDRIQTAREWILLIDSDERRKMHQSKAETNLEVKKMISQLISETASFDEPDQTAAARIPEPEPEPEKRPEPQPVIAESQRPRRKRPTLIEPEEFQQVMAEIEHRKSKKARKRGRPAAEATIEDDEPTNSNAGLKLVKRRLATVTLLGALAFNISQSPDASVLKLIETEIRNLIEVGTDVVSVADASATTTL